jgi:hypothetical protein
MITSQTSNSITFDVLTPIGHKFSYVLRIEKNDGVFSVFYDDEGKEELGNAYTNPWKVYSLIFSKQKGFKSQFDRANLIRFLGLTFDDGDIVRVVNTLHKEENVYSFRLQRDAYIYGEIWNDDYKTFSKDLKCIDLSDQDILIMSVSNKY